jgi:hypothetical protein
MGLGKFATCQLGLKLVGCKWIFNKKLKPDGTVYKYKVMLVAKGFIQKKGEHYFGTQLPS